ncbi:MAG: hypothetical protein Phyf2KO_01830 [Phycisphaerales bacterium]
MDPMLVWGLGLLALAVFLLAVEVIVPSGGVIALVSGVVGIAGVVCLFMMKEGGTLWGVSGTLMLLIVFPSSFAVWVKVMPNTSIGRRMMGIPDEREEQRAVEVEQSKLDELMSLIGTEGVARSPLRPVGSVEIEGQTYQALAEGVAIERGQRIRVTQVVNAQIKVRPV